MNKIEILQFLQQNKQKLANDFGVIKIGLFGSYARGEENPGSDIDIVVEIESSKKTLKNFMGLKYFIEESLHKNVDLGIESSLKPLVKDSISKEIIYV